MGDKGKLIRIVYYVIVALLVLIAAQRIFNIDTTIDVKNMPDAEKAKANLGLYLSYVLAIIAVLLWVGNFAIKLVTDFKSQIPSIIGVGFVIVVLFIAKSSVPAWFDGMKVADGVYITAKESVWSSAGLITMYVVAGMAIIAAVGAGIKALFE